MKSKWPQLREIEGVRWIAVNLAAQYASKKADWLREQASLGLIPSLEIDGTLHLQYAALNRLMREWYVPKPPTLFGVGLPTGRQGPISAHREKQDVLPMSSGRKGRGWIS